MTAMSKPPATVPVHLTPRQAGVVISILFTYGEVFHGNTAREGVTYGEDICEQLDIDPEEIRASIRSELRGVPRWLLWLRGK